MDAETYLHWLRTADLETTRLEDFRQAVEEVVAALKAEGDGQEPGEMQEALTEILHELHAGGVPKKQIETFREDFLYDGEQHDPPEVVLEKELREIAAGISRERWSTETYQSLEKAIDAFLDGGAEESLWSTTDSIEELLTRVSDSYRQTAILPKEVTMESMVTHRLLCEGIEGWRAALAMLKDDEPAEGDDEEQDWDWDLVLKTAERGNRLLVAVQIYQSRLRNALSTY
jgi:hypothetical protein